MAEQNTQAVFERGLHQESRPGKTQEETDRDFITATMKKFKDSYEATQSDREIWKSCYGFVTGRGQWGDNIKAELDARGEPALTINKILPNVNLVSGVERRARQEWRAFPVESGDEMKAELFSGLVKYVSNKNHGDILWSNVFAKALVTGLQWVMTMVDTSENLEGDIKFFRDDPLNVFHDPNWDYDLLTYGDQCEYVFRTWFKTPADVARTFDLDVEELSKETDDWFKEKPTIVREGDVQIDKRSLFEDPSTRRIRLLEFWYKRWEKIPIVVEKQSGSIKPVTDEFLAAYETIPEMQERFQLMEREVKRVWVATIFGSRVLQHGPAPGGLTELPMYPVIGVQYEGAPLGLVETMRDPQQQYNKHRSKITAAVNRMPQSGFFNQELQGADPIALEKYIAGEGAVIPYKTVIPQQVLPPTFPNALAELENRSDRDVRDSSGVNAELVGQTTQKTVSGKAIEARQSGGLIIQEPFFDSFNLAKIEVGRRVVYLIKEYISPARAVRILGAEVAANAEGDLAKQFDTLKKTVSDLEVALKDVFTEEYDIVVADSPASPTIRAANFSQMVAINQQFPGAVPPQILMEISDIPVSIKRRLLAHMNQLAQQSGGQIPAAGTPEGPSPPRMTPMPGASPTEG